MKVKVNPVTGMVACIALAGMMNRQQGKVFGALPKDAARLLSTKHIEILPESELPKLPEGKKWAEVDINPEKGEAGTVTGLSTTKTPEQPKAPEQPKSPEQPKAPDSRHQQPTTT